MPKFYINIFNLEVEAPIREATADVIATMLADRCELLGRETTITTASDPCEAYVPGTVVEKAETVTIRKDIRDA